MRVAIIGAGMAGLACADALGARGHAVTLFDKGRGPGGRMSTRRLEVDGAMLTFDHGAQYFTARDPAFVARVADWETQGAAVRWPLAGNDAWVGTPGMNAPIRAAAAEHDVRWGKRVDSVTPSDDGWTLTGVSDAPTFDAVVVAVPAEQVAALLAPAPAMAAMARASASLPCWTVMAAFAEPIAGAPDLARDLGPIGWAVRESAKPGRAPGERWVMQAAPDWSRDHLEDDAAAVATDLLACFADQPGVNLPAPIHLQAHRWRYARAQPAASPAPALWDPALRLGACGDWLIAPRVEAAWLSGHRLGGMIAG